MKKIIILLTILLSTIFSNVAFADIMVPGQGSIYKEKKVFCPGPDYYSNTLFIFKLECSNNIKCNKNYCILGKNTKYLFYFFLFFLIFIIGIFIYKRKKHKKG